MASIAQPPVELPPRGTTRDVLTDIVNACAAKGPHDSLFLACLAAKHLPVGARVVATYRREGGWCGVTSWCGSTRDITI